MKPENRKTKASIVTLAVTMLLSTSVYAASDDLTYVKVNADVNTSRATTNELNTVAIGPSANADASGSIAIGLKSSTIKSSGATNANDAIAIGTSSSASNTGSVAIGKSTSSSNGGLLLQMDPILLVLMR